MSWNYRIFFSFLLFYTLCFELTAQRQDSLSKMMYKESQIPAYYRQTTDNPFKSHRLTPAVADDPLSMLQGQIPGMMMTRAGGDPLQPFSLRVHGISSLHGSNRPQIWVDGCPADDLLLLRQEDIDSITVLQDAASTAMYGQGAASGVILIKTKSGVKSGFSAQYQTGASLGTYANRPTLITPSEFRARGGQATSFGFVGNTNWQDEVIQSPVSNTHHLFLAQNAQKWGIKASGAYQLREGLLKNSQYNQLNGRIGGHLNLLNNRIKLNGGAAVGRQNAEPGFVEAMRYATTFTPLSLIRDDNNSLFVPFGGYVNTGFFDYFNPVAILEQNLNFNEKTSGMGYFGAEAQVSPRFSIATHLSSRYFDRNSAEYYPERALFRGGFTEKARLSIQEQTQLYADVVATYKWKTSSSNWVFNAAWIINQENNIFKYREGRDIEPKNSSPKSLDDIFKLNLSDAITNGFSIDRNIDKNNSGFLASFSMDRRLLALQGGIRSLSASGTAPNRPKTLLLPFLSAQWGKPSFRLMANFGQSANQQFDQYVDNGKSAYFGKKTEFSLGTSTENNTFKIGAQLFSNQSKDLATTFVPSNQGNYLAAEPDYSTTLTNNGLALEAMWKLVSTSDLSWDIGMNFNVLYSKVKDVKLTSQSIELNENYLLASSGGPGQGDVFYQRIYKGSRIGEFWAPVFSGINENGLVVYADQNNNGFQDLEDYVKKGSGLPSRWLTIQNHIRYDNFEIDFRLRSMGGYYQINENILYYSGATQWNNIVLTDYDDPRIRVNQYNDKILEKSGFLRLDLIQFGYRFQVNTIALNLAIGAQNLFTISRFSGSDPEPMLEDSGPKLNGAYYIEDISNSLSPGIERRHHYWPEKNYFLRLSAAF